MTNQTTGFQTTYGQLKAHVAAVQTARGFSKQQVMNSATALNGWMRRLNLQDSDFVVEEMGEQFNRHYEQHGDYLQGRVSTRTARDQAEHLLTWRRFAEECKRIDMLPADFKTAFNALVETSGMSLPDIARASGVPISSIRNWLYLEGLPVGHSANSVANLEKALNVPNGTLLNRIPGRKYSRYSRATRQLGQKPTTSWGQRNAANAKTLGPYAAKLSGRLQTQWHDLIDYKSDRWRNGSSKRDIWRLKPAEETGCRILPPMVSRSGAICTTAGAVFAGVSSYLGFVAMPYPGKAIGAEEAHTLAWLVHLPYLLDYAKWLMERANGQMHNGIPKFLDDVKCMVRPNTGFIWLHPELADTIPASIIGPNFAGMDAAARADAWRQHCAALHLQLRDKVKAMRGGLHKVTRSRDPREPIAAILASPSPLKSLLKLIHDIESNQPPAAHHRDYITWIRDMLLFKMLASNPLRASHFARMTYRPDNRGNLYRAADGTWRLRFKARDFKNESGAAHEDYDVAVEPSTAPWITRYLAEARPYGIGAGNCDYLFLPFVPGPNKGTRLHGTVPDKGGMWTSLGIGNRVKYVTRQYLPDCPGFMPHAVRHLVATDHLRRHPGDFPTVAKLLHDKLETVLREYSHVTVDQGLSVLHKGIAELSADFA